MTAFGWILLLAQILFITAEVVAQEQEAEDTQTATLRGTVINSVTREPLERALVYTPDQRFAAMTDNEGHFEFNFPSSREDEGVGHDRSGGRISPPLNRPNMLMAKRPGFLEDENSRAAIEVKARDVTIALTPEALIIGHVVLPSSDDTERISLNLYKRNVQDGRAHWMQFKSVESRSSGEFRFAELPAGEYKLLTGESLDRDPLTFDPRGQQYGYPPVYFPNASDFASAEIIQLSPGKTFQARIVLVRHAYYPVKIPVANVPPGPWSASINVYAHGRGPGYSLGYNNQQSITGMLPDGNYTVEASSFGQIQASGITNLAIQGAPPAGAALSLVTNSSITVNVKEEFSSNENVGSFTSWSDGHGGSYTLNGPRNYLNIILEPADDFSAEQGNGLHNPTGPEDEALFIDNVRPGRYWVRVNSYRGYASSVTCGTVDLQRQPLVVVPGASTCPIELTMRDDWSEIEGTVEDLVKAAGQGSDASPFSVNEWPRVPRDTGHVYLIPLPDASGEFRDIPVGRDGKFNAQRVIPGVYRALVFDHPQELEYHSAEAMRAYESAGQVVHLDAGQKEHLTLRLPAVPHD